MTVLNLTNSSFEEGNTNGWVIVEDREMVVVNDRPAYEGQWLLAVRGEGTFKIEHSQFFGVLPGDLVTASMWLNPTRGSDRAHLRVVWYNSNNMEIGHTEGTQVVGTGAYRESRIANVAPPANATRFRFALHGRKYSRSHFGADALTASQTINTSLTLVSPPDGAEYQQGAAVPLRAEVSTTGTATQNIAFYVDDTLVGSVNQAPFVYNYLNAPLGSHTVFARMTMVGGMTLDSAVHTFNVVEEPTPPDRREYNASNAYTQLVMENFSGLSTQIPSTARVTGVEVMVNYKMKVLSRTRDAVGEDILNSNDLAPFDLVPSARMEAVLLDTSGGYTVLGASEGTEFPINRSDFELVETGVSEGKKWTVRESEMLYAASVGGEDFLWNQSPLAYPDFINRAIGVRFVLQPGAKPDYTGAGDAAFRFFIDSVRVRIYFDAGSVEYYFVSPGKDKIIKGTLVASYVLEGNLRTGDAAGVMQLLPTLEIMSGGQRWIGNDWTIHAAYPPTDANQIGEVADLDDMSMLGMEYNGLPTQKQVLDNRSRYLFKTENFYGDPDMNAMYGVHGLPRAFTYNGEYFHKIYTHSDPETDKPRSVANHHGHLALGFHGGRVDISVVGEPYNFSGVDGASSWAFGDKVVGLLPLSGTILGVFGSKSVWGISGTTVDNFATQMISPNIGAIEYTIADMGFPVYANAYGIYTLNQTQQYGDYLGQPMSQDISPWIRPRLLRKATSNKEVVCAWPVRSKNQYRVAFSDGYVASMTLNGQQVPTFSFQKYFHVPSGEWEAPGDMYEYPSIVPAAISSELDDAGEERIHVAPVIKTVVPPPLTLEVGVVQFYSGGET